MRFLFHAPNVNTGGGLRLLQSLLSVEPCPVSWAQMDRRVQDADLLPKETSVHFVGKTVLSRLMAEWRLRRECRRGDVVLCFHGLPPLFPLRGRAVVFMQNRLLLERSSLTDYPLRVRVRLSIERWWCRVLQDRCSHYIVQTPSMAASLKRLLKKNVPVSVTPFAPETRTTATPRPIAGNPRFDFVYVASGEAHKNHLNLLEAWRLLAEMGHRPSLALTIDEYAHPELCQSITRSTAEHQLKISNLGMLSVEAVDDLYRAARALIYPSTCESLGLPLIEAHQKGLPILASERDYVRDVVEPAQTFDPSSPVSIARAAMRFLGACAEPMRIGTAKEFLADVLR